MKRRSPVRFSYEELAFIEKNKDLPRADLHFEFVTTFDRFDVGKRCIQHVCVSRGWRMESRPGRSEDFKLGFRKIGTGRWEKASYERSRPDGYIEVYSPVTRRFTGKHRALWELRHGPIPPGHVLKCKTTDRANCSLSNWTLIPQQMLGPLIRRGYEAAPPALKETILAVTRLEYEARQKLWKSGSRRKG